MRRWLLLMLMMCAAPVERLASADEERSSSLQQRVEESADKFAEAFSRRDAEAIGRLFTSEAEYVDASGTVFHGRDAIEAELRATFEQSLPGTMTVELISIRPIAAGVIVEDGVSTFMPDGEQAITQTRYSATHVKQSDGTWLMASVRELEAARMTPHERLLALSWLIGGWHEDVDNALVTTEWRWSDDRNYLLSDFQIRQSAEANFSGSHRIGWDAGRKQFRSWVFESGGGALEGWWRVNEDGSWSVSLSGLDEEGEPRSSVMTYVADGADALVVTQTDRVVGGESLPGAVHRVVRRPPALESPAAQPGS